MQGAGCGPSFHGLAFKRQVGARPDHACLPARLYSGNNDLSLRIIQFIYFVRHAVHRARSQEPQVQGRLSYGLFVTLDKPFVSSGPQFPHL